MEYFLFVVGLIFIIKAGDSFVDSSINIAKIYKVSDVLIGATVVSVGTTLPETLVSATAAIEGLSEISYGNALGSIFCNTALILAISLIVKNVEISRKSILSIAIFFYVAFFYYMIVSFVKHRFDRIDGIVLFSIFIIYIIYMIRNKDVSNEKSDYEYTGKTLSNVLVIIISGMFLAIGSKLLVENGTIIAKNLGVPNSVIAITIVALGTSLPELTTCINSIVKGHSGLSIGNIIGADLFNLVIVSAVSIIIRPFSIPSEKLVFGLNSSLVVDIPIIFIAMSLVILPILIMQKTYKKQGILLILMYILFCIYQYF